MVTIEKYELLQNMMCLFYKFVNMSFSYCPMLEEIIKNLVQTEESLAILYCIYLSVSNWRREINQIFTEIVGSSLP